MKKTVLTFGLISGAILSAMMLITMPFHEQIGFDRGLYIGYTTMVAAFLLIFFGVRSYRDNVSGGTIRFGRAVAVGGLIALIASLCYVATWEVLYYTTGSDYVEKYNAYVIEKERAEGKSEAEIAKKRAELEDFAKKYHNPVINVGVTLLEPLPVALVMTLVSAGVLSRRRRDGQPSFARS